MSEPRATMPGGIRDSGDYSHSERRRYHLVIEQLLVATDLSEASEPVLAYGRELARTFGAALHVVYVVERFFTVTGIEGYITDADGRHLDVEQTARQRLDRVVADEDRRMLHAKAVVLRSDKPAQAVVTYAREFGIDLIVIGAHSGAGC